MANSCNRLPNPLSPDSSRCTLRRHSYRHQSVEFDHRSPTAIVCSSRDPRCSVESDSSGWRPIGRPFFPGTSGPEAYGYDRASRNRREANTIPMNDNIVLPLVRQSRIRALLASARGRGRRTSRSNGARSGSAKREAAAACGETTYGVISHGASIDKRTSPSCARRATSTYYVGGQNRRAALGVLHRRITSAGKIAELRSACYIKVLRRRAKSPSCARRATSVVRHRPCYIDCAKPVATDQAGGAGLGSSWSRRSKLCRNPYPA
jgi:hypothetical protein